MRCENCQQEHQGTYGSGRYCSRSCANRRHLTKEAYQKIAIKLKDNPACKQNEGKGLLYKKEFRNCPICNSSFYGYWKNTCGKKDCVSKHLSIKLKGKCGGYRYGSGRGKGSWYQSKNAGIVYLDSSWELHYAQWLDKQNVNWIRNTQRFQYEINGEKHYYIPDFYIVENNSYVEVKGFKRSNDDAKWSQFPFKLQVLFKKDLQTLGVVV